jgi:hypothetical protein
MDYHRIYSQLIERARNRQIDGYLERHHVVPKCIDGTDDSENLVDLTPEEHYVAHQLLVKIYPKNHDLVFAASMMASTRPGNKLYGWLKRKHIASYQYFLTESRKKARADRPRLAAEYWKQFHESEHRSIGAFAESVGKSHVYIAKLWKEYIPGYRNRTKRLKSLSWPSEKASHS